MKWFLSNYFYQKTENLSIIGIVACIVVFLRINDVDCFKKYKGLFFLIFSVFVSLSREYVLGGFMGEFTLRIVFLCSWILMFLWNATKLRKTKRKSSPYVSPRRSRSRGGGGGARGYFLGGYVPPGTPNWHPVLNTIFPKIATPF